MKSILCLMTLFAICHMTLAGRHNITCFYDTSSVKRGGYANFTETDLKASMSYCTHIVYGYVGLKTDSYDIKTLHSEQKLLFAQVRKLKNKYRHIQFLLSLGGDRDLKKPNKYMKLLAAPGRQQDNFIKSVQKMLYKYKFDGFDLAYQFPHDKPDPFSKVSNMVEKYLGNGHGFGSKENVQKQQFTTIVNKLKNALRRDRYILTLTVLPHVNSTTHINIPAIMEDFDFINLGTYDYSTPQRTPKMADYLAALYNPPHRGKQSPGNVHTDVQYWLSARVPSYKLNIGIPAYARSWKMTKALKSTELPIHESLDGPAQGGELTHTPGLLSWPEICFKLVKMSRKMHTTYGHYAYRSANVKGQDGLLITYEDRYSLAEKADYVNNWKLGGVAIFDITLDDFRNKCKLGRFPALKTIKLALQ